MRRRRGAIAQALKRGLALGLGALALAAASAWASECAAPPAGPYAPIEVPRGTRVGLALGSGSMHGIAHIGVLQEIEARGLRVDIVTGTSVGALMGALWASGVPAGRIEAITRERVPEWNLAGTLQGIFSTDAMRAPLEAAFAGRPIEAWPKRFAAVTTDVATGERRVLAAGDGATAVQASSAIPVLFRPVVVAGQRLVDGALVEPVPVVAARELGADVVIGVDVAYRPHEEEARRMTQYAFQAMHILVNSLATVQLRSADVAMRLNVHRHYMDCGEAALVAAGREAVDRAWPEIASAVARHAKRREARR